MAVVNLSRRDFLKASAAAAGALVLGFRLEEAAADPATLFAPNAWLEIHPDDRVVIRVPWSELGQGPLTAVPMLLADELEADWDRIEIQKAWSDPQFGNMGTGGSRSVRTSWDPVRQAGAAARVMLLEAAARTWGVPVDRCRAVNGRVTHLDSDKTVAYGRLVGTAAGLAVPANVPLKDPADRTFIGKSLPRVDTMAKITGQAEFGCDQRLPGLKFAVVARAPRLGDELADFSADAALKIPGVSQVFKIGRGVAVVADDTWTALKGREALKVTWTQGEAADLDSRTISGWMARAAPEDARVMRQEGDFKDVLLGADKIQKSVYELPFLSHSPLEPMNCTVRLGPDSCEIWAPIQSVSWGQGVAAQITGLPREKVRLQPTYAGGGFGRRLMVDYVSEAVEIATHLDHPVQLFWTREDDFLAGMFRPASRHTLRGGIDSYGRITAWEHHLACPSIGGQLNPDSVPDGYDESAVDGAANLPYEVDALQVLYSMVNTPVPTCWLRSVYNTQNALANECFFDELAALSGLDPVELRLRQLPAGSRLRGTLAKAKEIWGWPRKLPAGHGQGVACHTCFGSSVTMMAEVSVDAANWPRVHRVLAVVDCGPVVHPDGLAAQVEGAVGFALSALLREEITIAEGRIQQENFDNYPPLRINEMPEVDVVTIDSEDEIGGIGEPGYPPLGPAVLNALHDATGVRVRKLPVAGHFKL